MEICEWKIFMISKAVGKYTQKIYAAVVRAIQSEWIFLQQISTNMGDMFAVVDKMIWENFLPLLLYIKKNPFHPL